MKKLLGVLIITVAAFATSANADPLVFTTTLIGANEVPPVASPGIGTAVVTVDGNIMSVSVTFSALLGNTTASHIHCCVPPGANAPVATAVPTFPGFPLGVTSGSYTQSFDLTLASTYNPAFVTARGGLEAARLAFLTGLLNGQTYFNIHTNLFPGGEIRGQLVAVPEPATLLLLATGLGGVAAKVGRRRKAKRAASTEEIS